MNRRAATGLRRAARGLVGAVLVVLAVGCGAPDGSRSADTRAVPVEDVPYGLLNPEEAEDPRTGPVAPAASSPAVYLVDGQDQLVAVPVRTSAAGAAAGVQEVLDVLLAGPTEEQRAAGLTSSTVPGLALDVRAVRDGTALVDLVTPERDPSAERLPLLVGEVVLSVTSVDGVDAVQLLVDDEVVEVPLPDGARTEAPVGAADYASLVATGP